MFLPPLHILGWGSLPSPLSLSRRTKMPPSHCYQNSVKILPPKPKPQPQCSTPPLYCIPETDKYPLYRMSEKDWTPFFYFPRCPVCGEWCRLHWLLLDTPSFDWNTPRSHGHKIFKMAPTKKQNFWKRYNIFRTPVYRMRHLTLPILKVG